MKVYEDGKLVGELPDWWLPAVTFRDAVRALLRDYTPEEVREFLEITIESKG